MYFISTVLPPIPTTGLTVADVTELSIRVREQMVAALREISSPAEPSSSASSQSKPPVLGATSPSLPSEKVEEDAKEVESAKIVEPVTRPSTAQSEVPPSPTMSRTSISENGTETEEDDGMVLVGRPT